jgi:hypothetical protein
MPLAMDTRPRIVAFLDCDEGSASAPMTGISSKVLNDRPEEKPCRTCGVPMAVSSQMWHARIDADHMGMAGTLQPIGTKPTGHH